MQLGRISKNGDPTSSLQGILRRLSVLKNWRATSIDRIPKEFLKVVQEVDPNILEDAFDSSMRHGVFLKAWKDADIICLKKKAGGRKPICLLPAMGKVLDKILAKRLMRHLETTGGLNHRQYGSVVRRRSTTTDAIDALMKKVFGNRTAGRHSLVVTLDVRHALIPALVMMKHRRRLP